MVPPSALDRFAAQAAWAHPVVRRERWALHIALFLMTLFTTTVVGAGLSRSFHSKAPVSLEQVLDVVGQIGSKPRVLLEGLPFSLTLMTILLAHELGHYFTCLRYAIDASPPYFLPAPTLIGTFGAFIRIRGPIYTRRALFDVGVSGPIAGFAALAPPLVVGLLYSDSSPGIANRGDLVFGTPLALRLLEWVFFHGLPIADINLHPVARAASIGLFATALNLLPIGQLDGGHISYAFFGALHKRLSQLFVFILVLLSWHLWYLGWLVLAVLLLVVGLRHPIIFDTSKLGATRVSLGWLALILFLLSFTLAPVR